MDPIKKLVLIGSGNVAGHLGLAFRQAGVDVAQVYSRTLSSAESLAESLGCLATDQLPDLVADADLYLIAISDDAIEGVVNAFPHREKFIAHTSGSVSMDVLSACTGRYGVFYPLQTFSKGIALDYSSIPICIEAFREQDGASLKELAAGVTDSVYQVDSDKRRQLHVAAVFACNFVNHMYALSADVATSANLPFDLLRPLIRETARKVMEADPHLVQTGPARRMNHQVLASHLAMLSDRPSLQKMYELISESIMDVYLEKK